MKKILIAIVIGYSWRAFQKSYFWSAVKRVSMEKFLESMGKSEHGPGVTNVSRIRTDYKTPSQRGPVSQ